MSVLELNDPSICANLTPVGFPSIGATSLTLTAQPLGSSDVVSACSLNLNTGDAGVHRYTLYATNGNGGGLSDGHLQLFSYNTSTDWVQQVLDIAPQDAVNPLTMTANAMTYVGGGGSTRVRMEGGTGVSSIRSATADGSGDPAQNTLLLGTGNNDYVKLTDYQLQVIGSDGVTTGRVYDTVVNPPPAGLGGIIVGAEITTPASVPVTFTAPTAGTYLFVFQCRMACDATGVGAGANIQFGLSELAGVPVATYFAGVSQATAATNLMVQGTTIGVIPTVGDYNFVAAPVNTGTAPTYNAYSATVQAYRLL